MPSLFEYRFLGSGHECEFLALYDVRRGILRVYGPSRNGDACFEYGPVEFREQYRAFGHTVSTRTSAWGGHRPVAHQELEKALRPWARGLDAKYAAFQEQEWAKVEAERKEQQAEASMQRRKEETESQFPLYSFSARYRIQDYLRLHPGEILYRGPIYNHIEMVATQCSSDLEVAGFRPKIAYSDFLHIRIDGDDTYLWFDDETRTVDVVTRKSLKTKRPTYGHTRFSIPSGRWQNGDAPARAFALRGLIYDYLAGIDVKGERLDHEASVAPYFVAYDPEVDYAELRAPWPPVRRDGKVYGINIPLPSTEELKEAQAFADGLTRLPLD